MARSTVASITLPADRHHFHERRYTAEGSCQIKAIVFIALYSAVETKDTVDRKTRKKVSEPVYVSGVTQPRAAHCASQADARYLTQARDMGATLTAYQLTRRARSKSSSVGCQSWRMRRRSGRRKRRRKRRKSQRRKRRRRKRRRAGTKTKTSSKTNQKTRARRRTRVRKRTETKRGRSLDRKSRSTFL